MNTLATNTLSRLESAVQAAVTDFDKANALNSLAWELRHDDPHRVRTLSLEAERLAERANSLSARAYSLRNQGFSAWSLSEQSQALSLLRLALTLSRHLMDEALEASCLNLLGLSHYYCMELSPALEHYQQALEIYRNLAQAHGIGAVANNIGLIYYNLGDYQTCIQHYVEALAAFECDEVMAKNQKGMTLANIGRVYWEVGDYQSALRYHQESLHFSQAVGSKSLISYALTSLGVTYCHLQMPGEAFSVLRQAFKTASSLEKKNDLVDVLHYRGMLHGRLGKFRHARRLLQRALAVEEVISDQEFRMETLYELGLVCLRLNDPDAAHLYLKRSLTEAEAQKKKKWIAHGHETFANLCEQAGELADALMHYKMFHAAEQALAQEQAEKRTASALIQMEVDKAQRESELQRLINIELEQKNTDLSEANRQKADLLEQLHRLNKELKVKAQEDSLTGLFNRRHLEERLAEVYALARRTRQPLSIVIADLDHFKQVNDCFSHAAGDRVLRGIARLFRRHCRESDLVARYGGEEFVLVLPNTTAMQARVVCENIRRAVAAHSWHHISEGLRVTMSFGISDDLSLGSHERMLTQADRYLYEAKNHGRNRVHPL